jgi:tetratricopeptide (TPR) repeat protein
VTAESKESPDNVTSFEQHPLYDAAMKQMAAGDEAGAAAKLRELAKLFPGEQLLQNLLVRTELQATLAKSGPVPNVRSAPTPTLRRVVLLLLGITMALVVIAGLAAANERLGIFDSEEKKQDLYINSLLQECQTLLAAGDWMGAQQKCQEVLTPRPGDPTAVAAIGLSQQQAALADLYVDALAAQQLGDVQTALNLFRQIEAQSPGYGDVAERIKALEELERLEVDWQQSESLIQAGDWLGAIAILSRLWTQYPDFRHSQVGEQLYQLYAQVAREQLAQAGGSVEAVREATKWLGEALALRPGQQDLAEEYHLATAFVAGADAADRGNWTEAITRWESVYVVRRDYADGVLRGKLDQAYVQGAKQLIADANGRVNRLNEALGYLDKALARQPGNQDLIEERRLVAEYLAGAEAFAQEEWDLAMSHWGTIYTVQPSYQNGVLEDRLRQACEQSSAPDQALCPP